MTTPRRFPFGIAAAVLAISLCLGSLAADAAQQQTGQGIMVNLVVPADLGVVMTDVYAYSREKAAAYFSNAWDGSAPTVTCSGSAAACTNPAPPAPAAPPPDPKQVDSLLPASATSVNKCTFFTGGTLAGHPYTQAASITVGAGASRRTYVYTYTYVVAPVANPVGPLTAWVFVFETNTDGTVPVAIDADVAGQSALQSSNQKLGLKYSFSLLNSDGTSRVQNLALSFYPNPAFATPASRVVSNCPGCLAGAPGAVDFAYTTNAGSNGNVSLLQDGDARTILNTDGFAGNDNGGADGSALSLAVMDTVDVSLVVGDYTLVLTGTVKDNAAQSQLTFSVSQILHIIGPTCGIMLP